MSFFPSLPQDNDLLALWKRHNRGLEPLLAYHDAILRGPSQLSEGERELIAAYVSALNGCRFCFAAHRAHAIAWEIAPEVFTEMAVDPGHPSLPAKLGPVLAYVEKLTRTPHAVEAADAEAVLAAGYGEAGLYDIISVTALFNFMNRMVEGSGIKQPFPGPQPSPEAKRKIRYSDHWKAVAAATRQKEES